MDFGFATKHTVCYKKGGVFMKNCQKCKKEVTESQCSCQQKNKKTKLIWGFMSLIIISFIVFQFYQIETIKKSLIESPRIETLGSCNTSFEKADCNKNAK